MKNRKTMFAKPAEIKRDWYLIDATGKTLGRMVTTIAAYLRGKHKPIFTPQVDCGDFIVVINAEKVRISGRKDKQKGYFRHSGFPGGDRMPMYEKLFAQSPRKVITHAVAGMLPKNRLGRALISKLRVYVGDKHPHQAQKIQKLELPTGRQGSN